MRNYERLSILVSLVLVGLAFSLIVTLPTRIIQGSFLGSPVSIAIDGQLFMAGLLTALTAIGTDYTLRDHPRYEATAGYAFLFWIIPCIVTLAAALFLPRLAPELTLWAVGLGLTGAVLSLVIVAEYRTIDPKDRAYTPARLGLNLVVYLAALVLFTGIYSAKLRSLLSATTMVVLAGLLALALLRAERRTTLNTWLYAGICALILGEATWALNYWGVSALAGGALLLLAFYFFAGLAQQQLLGRFNRVILLEFLFVVGFGFGLLISQTSLRW